MKNSLFGIDFQMTGHIFLYMALTFASIFLREYARKKEWGRSLIKKEVKKIGIKYGDDEKTKEEKTIELLNLNNYNFAAIFSYKIGYFIFMISAITILAKTFLKNNFIYALLNGNGIVGFLSKLDWRNILIAGGIFFILNVWAVNGRLNKESIIKITIATLLLCLTYLIFHPILLMTILNAIFIKIINSIMAKTKFGEMKIQSLPELDGITLEEETIIQKEGVIENAKDAMEKLKKFIIED